jgi:hypothetical protein
MLATESSRSRIFAGLVPMDSVVLAEQHADEGPQHDPLPFATFAYASRTNFFIRVAPSP